MTKISVDVQRFIIDITGTVISWGVDESALALCVAKGIALSPSGTVTVRNYP